MEFVPMFWGATSIPLQPFDQATHEEFVAASNLLTFNEPERIDQANMTPAQAAALWPQIEAIASTYDLKIVGPCMTKDAYTWYNDFLAACTNCRIDYTCIHTYYQPMPCTGPDWECIGTTDPSKSETFFLEYTLDKWYNNYGKPIWVTEYGCYPWDIAGEGCDAAKHEAIMEQQTRVFEADDRVERYNWFSTYAFDNGFKDGALNVPNYDVKHGTTCPNNFWLEGIFESRGWGIHQYHECVASAGANTNCHKPLRLSFDDESCYCSTDACDSPVSSYPQMDLHVESSTLSRDASALTVIGQQYNSFGGNPPATPAPSNSASSSPSKAATSSPSRMTSPTKAPTVSPQLNCGAIDSSKVCNNETGGLCAWSGKNKVCTSVNPAPTPNSTPAPTLSSGGGWHLLKVLRKIVVEGW
jgi:hypothetical protein